MSVMKKVLTQYYKNTCSRKNINLPLLTTEKRHLAPSRSYVFTYEIFFDLLKVRVKMLLWSTRLAEKRTKVEVGEGLKKWRTSDSFGEKSK